MTDDKESKAPGLRPSAELKEVQEYNFAEPKLNIKMLNSAVSLPPRYGRAELTLARISKKLEAEVELTEEEEKWILGARGKDGKVDPSKGLMRKIVDTHYDLIFWKSPNARKLNAELVRNASKPQYNITVQDAGKGSTKVTIVDEKKAEAPGGGSS